MNLEEQTKAASRLAEIYQELATVEPLLDRAQKEVNDRTAQKLRLEGEAIQLLKGLKEPKPRKPKKVKEQKAAEAVSAYTRKTRTRKAKTPGVSESPAASGDDSQGDDGQGIGRVVGQIEP